MSRHKQFYADLRHDADVMAHPDDIFEEEDYEHANHGQHEYQDTCLQCHNYALGYADPNSHEFYCHHCWSHFYQSQPQSNQQSQTQTPNTNKTGKKKNKKKNKNKNKNTPNQQQTQQTQAQPQPQQQQSSNQQNTKNTQITQNSQKRPQNTQKQQKQQNIPKPEPVINKDEVLGDRPDFFGFLEPTPPTQQPTQPAQPPNDSIMGTTVAKTSQTPQTTSPNTAEPFKTPQKGGKSQPKSEKTSQKSQKTEKKTSETQAKKATKKVDTGYTFEGLRFVGERIESKKNYLKQQTLKKQLIEERFGIDLSQNANNSSSGGGSATEQKNGKNDKNEKKENRTKDASENKTAERGKLLKKATKSKPHINLVVIGHVDAGKSTLMGHLLYKYGKVSNKEMHKLDKEATEYNKSSFSFAYVLDVNPEERQKGITVDVSTNYFETPNRRVTLLDSPGHKDFVPNMISGTAQADAAILVINANLNEFEAGFSEKGQTREHALLAKSLGVGQLIVAINKMDMIDWDFDRYKYIVEQLTHFLKKIGFENKKKKQNITFIPVSGLSGENLLRTQDISKEYAKGKKKKQTSKDDSKKNSSKQPDWYRKETEYNTNLTLIELIDNLRPPSTVQFSIDYPLRMSITDIYKEPNLGGIMISGKIYSGSIVAKQQILIQPVNMVCKVKGLNNIEQSGSGAFEYNIGVSGDNIQLLLNTNISGMNNKDSDMYFEQIKCGDMITTPYEPIKSVNKFECRIVTIGTLKIPFVKGQEIVIHSHSVDLPAIMTKINAILDKKTGNVVANRARHVKADMAALVMIKLKNKKDRLCLDTYENHKQLGRVTIRREGETIALGIVTQL